MKQKSFYGKGIPGLDLSQLTGALIVVEGSDGSGRSTQIALLRDWLEGKGYATENIGLSRSALVSKEMEKAKRGTILGMRTLTLFYATDLVDQLENNIIPALRAGVVVLADRYIYALMVRALVRGLDRSWVKSIYSVALVPDIVFHLRVSPKVLVERNFQKNLTLDYWESGMDVGLSKDMFDSFLMYQEKIQQEYGHMAEEYGFKVVDGNRSVEEVWEDLQFHIGNFLVSGKML